MKKIYTLFIMLTCLMGLKSYSQCSTPTTTPYLEDFNIITVPNQLPPCWAASNLGVTCLTFTNGPIASMQHAAFYYSPGGLSYFYSHAIQLNVGITYTASVWHRVSSNTNVTWTDLSILLGPNQSPVGLIPLASTNGNVLNTTYAALSNTFTVASSGVYYIAVRATSNENGAGSPLLEWDDLTVTIPCIPAFNSPTITVAASSNTLCGGSIITATASGANTYTWTYAWSTGANTSTFSSFALYSSILSVVGTDTYTGCNSTDSVLIIVQQSPSVLATTDKISVCKGSSATLTGHGALTFSWSDGQQGTTVSVSPTVATIYTVTGTAANGCTASATQQIGVMPLPIVAITNSEVDTICSGEKVTLVAAGAASYQWNLNTLALVGNPITFTLGTTTTLTASGTGTNGCVGKATKVIQVEACTGLVKEEGQVSVINIYPNPGNGAYAINSGNTELKSIVIRDITGKIVFSTQDSNVQVSINLEDVCNGIYQARISSGSAIHYLKIIKQ